MQTTTPNPVPSRSHIVLSIELDNTDPYTHIALIVKCHHCSKFYAVNTDRNALIRWVNGEFIQDAMPDLTEDDRELLISGTCYEYWAQLEDPFDF